MNYLGLEVIVSESALVSRWIFPTYRFFEWEPRDERACRLMGEGHEVQEPGAFIVGGRQLIIHPKVWEQMQKVIKEVR